MGAELFNQRVVEEGRAEVEAAEAEAPQVGKRVVDITQPARRPARMERMAEQRAKEEQEEKSPAAPVEAEKAPVEGEETAPPETAPPETAQAPEPSTKPTAEA